LEAEVDDRGRIALSIGLGALLGGVAGFLVFTRRGRELREDFAPRLDELLTEVDNLRTTFDRARVAVADGVKSFNSLVSDESASSPAPGPRRVG
jgi:gas vesicle protein